MDKSILTKRQRREYADALADGVPPEVVHTFRNVSDATAIFLNIHAPSSGFGDVLRGRGESGFDQHDPPQDGGRPLADAVFTTPRDAETLEHEASMHRILCDLPQLTAIDMTFRPAFEGVDPHTHADHADCFYVLAGEAEFTLDGEPVPAGPGSFIAAPSGTVHGFRNAGDGELRLLNIHAPCTGFAEGLRHPVRAASPRAGRGAVSPGGRPAP